MKRDDLRIGILVGHGSYGYVYKAEMTRGVVAVKQVSQHANMPGVPQNACREIGLLRELKVVLLVPSFCWSESCGGGKKAPAHCELDRRANESGETSGVHAVGLG